MTDTLRPGLLVLHGNRLETLAETVFAWLREHPLAPLEQEVFLVQSNGMAEWLKMALAGAHGICAATRVELPARFLWRAYRAVLGRAAVPAVSALDKLPLTWRLMTLLPALAPEPGFEPVAGFLGAAGADAARRLQLAQRLADLFDQYQVYRGDWLQDWAAGRDRLCAAAADAVPVPADQRWQPALWRAALDGLAPAERDATRPRLHQRFLQALGAGDRPAPGLPRRLVLFGSTHLPQQTLEAIAALAGRVQVLVAVPDPCRYHWADTLDGRELLRAQRRRLPLKHGRDLAAVPLQDMHAHGHPLLAAWGRQARDFVRQLDAFDDARRAREQFALPRLDLFDDAPGATLLEQVQARIRDLVPLAEHPPTPLAPGDRSIVFHVAHGAQREVEVLHDQLLELLAHPPGDRPLAPRDIVVMVPDIDTFAPAIRAVFGQHARGQARHIPWGIADQCERGRQPLLVALEWLLRVPQQRFAFSELRDLLDVPAVARRLGLDDDERALLADWAAGAGVHWGLHAGQRAQLGLPECGEANTWRFGLQRMLLGYAVGELDDGFAGIEPYAEVAGLSARLAGVLAEWLDRLDAWWVQARVERAPEDWGACLRALVPAMFGATDDVDRSVLAALDEALTRWLEACEAAGFDEPVALPVVREAWLSAVDEPGGQRFKAGGVTFCTLLPLRAIPFEVVCLLGLNDGDYPRRPARSDFDLMALPGQARPGDRSRRDDDRQLMLDALLSARRVLHLSWAGRSARDNQAQPPSVLVAQLRDYLAAGWGHDAVAERTTEHPLQPFSRRYFEAAAEGEAEARPGRLYTYAAEWRSAHLAGPVIATPPPAAESGALRLTIARLEAFVRNPVKAYFRHRLQVVFDETQAPPDDDEPFATAGLDRWRALDAVLLAVRNAIGERPVEVGALAGRAAQQVARLRRAGRLPMAGPGARAEAALVQAALPPLARWQALRAAHPQPHDKLALRLADDEQAGLELDDWLPGLRCGATAGERPRWIDLGAARLTAAKSGAPMGSKLVAAWLRCLASAACGVPADGVLVGLDAVLHVGPPDAAQAQATLRDLMRACRDGTTGERPLPTAVRTGLAFLADPTQARAAFEGGHPGATGEGHEACLARLYPDFAALEAEPGFETATRRLYEPYARWLAAHVVVEPLPQADAVGDEGDD